MERATESLWAKPAEKNNTIVTSKHISKLRPGKLLASVNWFMLLGPRIMPVYSQQTKQHVNKTSQTLTKLICYSLRLLPVMSKNLQLQFGVCFCFALVCFKELCLRVLLSLATTKGGLFTIEECNFFLIHWIKLHIQSKLQKDNEKKKQYWSPVFVLKQTQTEKECIKIMTIQVLPVLKKKKTSKLQMSQVHFPLGVLSIKSKSSHSAIKGK